MEEGRRLEMLVDPKSKSLINVFLSGWPITVWAKDSSVLRPGYLIVFETPNASFFFYGKNPISPNYVRLPETLMYLPVLPHVLAFFFWSRSICYVVGPSVRKRYRSW